jgi:hypothetical protein
MDTTRHFHVVFDVRVLDINLSIDRGRAWVVILTDLKIKRTVMNSEQWLVQLKISELKQVTFLTTQTA